MNAKRNCKLVCFANLINKVICSYLDMQTSFCLVLSNNCCADCCRDKKNSVCRVHGTGYLAAEAAVESAIHQGFIEFDMRYSNIHQPLALAGKKSTLHLFYDLS